MLGFGGEVVDCGMVDEGRDYFRWFGGFNEGLVVVVYWDWGDLWVYIKEVVIVDIDDVWKVS